jgi:hypothetical protein
MMTPAHRASGVRKAPFEPRRRRGLQGASRTTMADENGDG